MEHLARPIGECWKDLGSPDLTPELQQTIIEGVLQEAGSLSLAQLARERDELLVGLLRLRSKLSKAGGGERTRSAAKRGTRSRRG